MTTPDILILGAGIIGCSLARELARVVAKVVVLERGCVGAGASSAAAGILAPTFAPVAVDPLTDLCFDSASLYEDWIKSLHEDGAGDMGFRRSGLFDLWLTEEQATHGRMHLPGQMRPGRRAQELSAQDVQRSEPAVAAPTHGGMYYPDDAQVDAAKLTNAVAGVAERAGVVIREREPVMRLTRDGDRISAVHTTRESYRPGIVVLTAGAWSGRLAEELGVSLPTHAVKGQMLMADCRVAPVQTPLYAGEALLVPQTDGRLSLGVTVEPNMCDERVTLEGIRIILDETCAIVPSIRQLPLERAWAGLRPATPDGWPYMGPVPPLHNFWISTGHYRKGILLAPLCAQLMAQSILANHPVEALTPFKPTRRMHDA